MNRTRTYHIVYTMGHTSLNYSRATFWSCSSSIYHLSTSPLSSFRCSMYSVFVHNVSHSLVSLSCPTYLTRSVWLGSEVGWCCSILRLVGESMELSERSSSKSAIFPSYLGWARSKNDGMHMFHFLSLCGGPKKMEQFHSLSESRMKPLPLSKFGIEPLHSRGSPTKRTPS